MLFNRISACIANLNRAQVQFPQFRLNPLSIAYGDNNRFIRTDVFSGDLLHIGSRDMPDLLREIMIVIKREIVDKELADARCGFR
jgi:hypothetical protein